LDGRRPKNVVGSCTGYPSSTPHIIKVFFCTAFSSDFIRAKEVKEWRRERDLYNSKETSGWPKVDRRAGSMYVTQQWREIGRPIFSRVANWLKKTARFA
jgi:hypothetical protein